MPRQGIHHIANAQMADGIRLVSVKRGFDAREFVLVPLGGGGSIPRRRPSRRNSRIDRVTGAAIPGVLSAAGLLGGADRARGVRCQLPNAKYCGGLELRRFSRGL